MRTMVLNPIKHTGISLEHAVPTDIDKAPVCQQLVKQPTMGCLHLWVVRQYVHKAQPLYTPRIQPITTN